MGEGERPVIDYDDPDVREEILVRQRREMWTPEQVRSLAGHFRLEPGHALLDAGCGHGYSLRTFGPFCLPGGRLVGIDREAALLETARSLAAGEGLAGAATFERGDLYDLPFRQGTFDAVMVQVVMCHMAEPERALDELIRVTRRGGCVAVFDNAVSGCDSGWDNVNRPTRPQALFECDAERLAARGRIKLGRGDWSVGLRMPGWMEARGLRDVDVRANERVAWIAPPYRSPAQRTTLENCRAARAATGWAKMEIRHLREELRAAGADEAMIARAVRAAVRRRRRFLDALDAGTAAFSHGGSFWCVWGFKG